MAEEKTVWQIISDTLTENGVDVFPPSLKAGECKKPYVVLKQDGSTQVYNYSTEKVYYRFMCYVPQNQYTEMDNFEKRVKEILNENLYPMILPVAQNEPDFFDDYLNAHLRTFLYRNNKRNKFI